MKKSITRDRSLLLMDALAEVLGPVSLDVDHVMLYTVADDAGGALYALHRVLARVRLAQSIGREIRE